MSGGSASTQGNEFLIPTPASALRTGICDAAPLPSPNLFRIANAKRQSEYRGMGFARAPCPFIVLPREDEFSDSDEGTS